MKLPATLLAILLALTAVTAAAAPVERTVADRFQFSVSWTQEPALLGDTNGINVRITENGEPVTGISPDIQIEVNFMEAVRVLNLLENEPGVYTGVFIPMQSGEYTFRVSGTIDGVEINETFTGADGLATVQPRLDYEFPNAAHGFEPVQLAVPVAASIALGATWMILRKRTDN